MFTLWPCGCRSCVVVTILSAARLLKEIDSAWFILQEAPNLKIILHYTVRIMSNFSDKNFDFTFRKKILQQGLNLPPLHTIRKVKFMSKNSILTKPQYFYEFFTKNLFDNFSRKIKAVSSYKVQNHNIFMSFSSKKKNRQFSREIKVEFFGQ